MRSKEDEVATSVDDLRRRSQLEDIDSPILRCLIAKIASSLKKVIQNSNFKKRVNLEEQKAQFDDRFLRGRQVALHDI